MQTRRDIIGRSLIGGALLGAVPILGAGARADGFKGTTIPDSSVPGTTAGAADPLGSMDSAYLEAEVWPGLEAAGETDLPDVATFLDTSFLADAHASI